MDDRKKRILEHLKQSGDGTSYISTKKTSQPTPPPSPTPEVATKATPEVATEATPEVATEATPEPKPTFKPTFKDDRKQKVMAHLNSSSGNFGRFSLEDNSKKKKIEEHIRKSLS